MNELLNEPKRLVDHYTVLALKESNTYQEAIDIVREYSEISLLGNELKNAIQSRITKIALDEKVKETHGTNNRTKSDCNSNNITFADYAT